MPALSVITAVDPTASEHLPEAHESLAQQAMLNDWTWEWLVQCDGNDAEQENHVRSLLPRDERISFRSSRKGGPGVARTMALARATGGAIKVLDADDRLTEGALARDIEAITQRGIGWTTCRVLDSTNGDLSPHYPDDPPGGRIRSGTVYKTYHLQDYRILVHPATLCIRYELLMALGGWMALPASEDTALLLALDAVTDGWFTEEVGLIYRRWPSQMSASAAHVDPEELNARRTLAKGRAEALNLLLDGL